MSAIVTLDPESVEAVAARVLDAIADRLAAIQAKQTSASLNEIPTEEAAKYCHFRKVDTFRRHMKERGVRPIRRGWWRKPALDRAMGGKV